MRKVAILHPDMGFIGGAELFIIQFANKLKRKGYSVAVFSTKWNSFSAGHLDSEITVNRIGIKRFSKGNRLYIWIMSRLLRKKLAGFDHVMVHNFPSTHWIYLLKKKTPVSFPSVSWYCHEPPMYIWRKDLRGYTGRLPGNLEIMEKIDMVVPRVFDRIITNSRFTNTMFERVYGMNSTASFHGVELGERDSFVSLPEEKNIGVLSRIYAEKNIDVMIEAMKILQMKYRRFDINLHIGGQGNHLNILKGKAGNVSNIIFRGFVDESRKKEFYRNLRIVTYFPILEPLGRIPIEAGACGRVVLASNQGGPAEVVQNNRTGYLLDPQNPEEIADKINSIIDNDVLLSQMGGAAADHIYQNFSMDSCVDRYLKLHELV